jgi:hypothetical protein
MKFHSVILTGISVLLLAGCKSKTAFHYSETIVKIERSLGPEIAEAREKITNFLDAEKYDSVAMVSERMEKLIDTKLAEVQKLETPKVKEGESFKRAAIRYFAFMRDTYTAYRKFAEQTTEAGREEERQKLVDIMTETQDAVREMQDAQRKYAEANNFRIEKK